MKKIIISSLLLILLPTNSFANTNEQNRVITFNVVESDKVAADAVRINFQVSSVAKSSKEALANNNRVANLARGVLKKENIISKDINSGNLYTSVEYDYSRASESKVVGFRASQNFTVTVKNIEKAGDIVDGLIDINGDNIAIMGVNPLLLNQKAEIKKIRAKAILEAKERINEYAQNFGVKVDKLLSVSESSTQIPIYPSYRGEMVSSADVATKFEFDDIEISVNLTVSYLIK
jgi:uncharacterized protein YggE